MVAVMDNVRTINLLALERDGRHPQDEFFRCEEPRCAYLGGIRIGKTMSLVIDAMDYADTWPGSRQVVTEPTYERIETVLLPAIDELYGPLIGTRFSLTRSPPHEMLFPNGSVVWLRSTAVEPSHHYGPTLARVLMDEATLGHQEEAYNILSGRCSDTRYPVRQVKVTGTPKGREWVWRRFVQGRLPYFFAETIDAERAGFVPKGYTEALAEQYGGWDAPLARQELGGQFIQLAGQVFPQFQRSIHIRSLPPEAIPAIMSNRA